MKRIIILASLIAIVILSPIPMGKGRGAYNTFSHTIYCSTKSVCLHEIAHKLDQESGWVSRTDKFSVAVQYFLYDELSKENPSDLVFYILDSPGVFSWSGYFSNPSAEVYANIFQWSEGKQENMPELFREFYDWEVAHNLIEKYAR